MHGFLMNPLIYRALDSQISYSNYLISNRFCDFQQALLSVSKKTHVFCMTESVLDKKMSSSRPAKGLKSGVY